MENIGNYLREKRQEKGKSLDEISVQTKLHINVLKSIESNEFSRLGGLGYTKILITTYARSLGLTDNEINTILAVAPKQDNKSPRQAREILHPPTILIHKNFLLLTLLVVIIIVLSFALIRLYQDDKLSFPFRSRPLEEEPVTPIVPEDEIDDEERIDGEEERASQGTEESNALTEIKSTDNLDIITLSDNEEYPVVDYSPPKINSFAGDRTDYLAKYEIISSGETKDKDNFAVYISSF
jgi:cytoskeletal protein RodZ